MKNRRLLSRAFILCAAVSLEACSGDKPVNIGNTMIGAQLSDYAATWDGYAEAYAFQPDGSDRVRLTLDASGNGTLEIGDSALLPAPTDQNVGFPKNATGSVVPSPGYGLSEGFLYPVHAANVQSDRIQLGVNPYDLWAAWCALQTSTFPYQYLDEMTGNFENVYTCVDPNAATPPGGGCAMVDPDGGTTPIDCWKVSLCEYPNPACTCTATGCTSVQVAAGTPVAQYLVELDGALDATGATLTGTVTGTVATGDRVTVHLTKQ